MPKEYATRVNSEAHPENFPVEVCECGHSKVEHVWILNYKEKGECEKCLCPKYEYEQTLSMGKYIDLERHIARTNRKRGNSQ